MQEALQRFVNVPFLDTVVRATNTPEHQVALKPLVEGIGLKWNGILSKIKKNKALSKVCTSREYLTDGGVQEMVCLPLDRLNGLLFLINPEHGGAD